MRTEITVDLRGRKVEINFAITERDPDVGILSEGFEDEEIRDADTGELLDWSLTDDESEALAAQVCKHIRGMGGDESDC